MSRQVTFLAILLLSLFAFGCSGNEEPILGSGEPQYVSNIKIDVETVQEAREVFSDWLLASTDFDPKRNSLMEVSGVDEYNYLVSPGYFLVRLEKKVMIDPEVVASEEKVYYQDFRLDSDGRVYGLKHQR